MVSQGSNNNPLPTNTSKECDLLKAKQEPGTTSQQGIVAQQQPMQQMKSEQAPIVTQQQSMQQMKSQQTPGTNQTNSATTTAKAPVVTFHMLIPILRRYLDKDRDMQVQSIFAKLRVCILFFLNFIFGHCFFTGNFRSICPRMRKL
jgi:transcription initiation factor TFIID subunit 4